MALISRRDLITTPLGGATLMMSNAFLAAVLARTPPVPALLDWPAVRKLFRVSSRYRHFAGFYLSSHPEPVRAAIDGFRAALDETPVLVVERAIDESQSTGLISHVQADVAAYIGGNPNEIALTPNTTTGLALVYHGLALGPEDEIVATMHDHFVHHEAIRLATQRNGASFRKISLFQNAATASVDEIVSNIVAGISHRTRALGLTWVHSATGIRLPMKEIAAAVAYINEARATADRVLLVVDGVHGLGAVDESITAIGADYFCAGTHKWMFGPRGTGIIWARAENWARLRPLIPQFMSPEPYLAWIHNRAPTGPTIANWISPGGFLAYEHQWAMGAAFRMHLGIGRARIAARITELNGRIKRGLAEIPRITLHTPQSADLSAGICCFEVRGLTADQVVNQLLARNIIASASPYAVSYARLSGGLLNLPEEIDEALAALRSIANRRLTS